jgi:hypothetical protein
MKPIPLKDLERLLGLTQETEASSEVVEPTQATLTADDTPLPLEALALLSVRTPEETIEHSESPKGQGEHTGRPLTESEELARLLGPGKGKPIEAPKSPGEMKRPASHIVDITEQYVGKSLIITGVAPSNEPLRTAAERAEALRKAMETATKTPPEKK